MEEMEIKLELDSEAEDYDRYDDDDNHDPDFNIADEYSINPAMKTASGVIKSSTTRIMKSQKPAKTKKPRELKLRCSYPNCSEFFRKQIHMETHVRQIHEGDPTPYHCTQCELKFKSPKILRRHQGKSHSLKLKTFPCPHCERSYQSKQYLALHVSEVHNAPPPKEKCPTCTKSFDRSEELQDHMELHNAIRTTDRPFSCVICNIHYTGILELQSHVFKTHEENFKCPNEGCDKAFLTKSKLYFHVKANHSSNDKSHLVCPECSYQARALSVLKKHMLKHAPASGRPSVTCDVEGCGKVFRHQITLTRHKKLDHVRDPSSFFKCTLCPKVFKETSSLTHHQAHHSNLRPFLCEHCSVSFKTLKNLKTHYKVHEKSTEGRRPQSVLSKARKGRLTPVLNL